jgi:hypothetical protein
VEELDVDAGRDLVHMLDVSDDVLEHGADVLGADDDGLRRRERLPSPRSQLWVAAHRVLELGPVGLDDERRADRGPHGPAEEDVVREDDVGRQVLAHSGGVQLDEALTLRDGAVL